MKTLINLCGKYRKWIYGVLTLALLLILCFPIQTFYKVNENNVVEDYFKIPFFATLPMCLKNIPQMSNFLTPSKNMLIFSICSFVAFVIFVILLITFWVLTAKNRKFPFPLLFLPVFAVYIFKGFYYTYQYENVQQPSGNFGTIIYSYIHFNLPVPAIILIVLICLYAFAVLFGKLYPRMQPKVAETVTKVADKVKAHKTKSQRIEELELQNAEMQKRLDELEKKD